MNRLKLTTISSAVLLIAASGSASAMITYNSATTPNGPAEIFVDVFSSSAGISYALDLGAPLNLSTSGGTYSLDPTLQDSGPTSDWSKAGTKLRWDLSNDAAWATFKGTSGVSAATASFDVKAIDGRTGAAIYGALTTVGSGDVTTTNNQTLNNYKQVAIGGLVDGVNTLAGMAAANGSTTATNTTGGAPGFQGYYDNGSGTQWHGFASYDSSGSVNTALPFYYLSRAAGGTSAAAIVAQYGDNTTGTLVPGLWTVNFAQNYVQYEVAAVPVPEPGTWAMMVAGVLAVAGIARRRLV